MCKIIKKAKVLVFQMRISIELIKKEHYAISSAIDKMLLTLIHAIHFNDNKAFLHFYNMIILEE